MIKQKVFSIIFITVTLCGTFLVFVGCKINNLKTSYINELENFLASKNENDYTKENYEYMYSTVNTAKQQLKKSNDVTAINNLVCSTKVSLDSVIPKRSDTIKNGAYFISELSWEKYVRESAESFGKNETWIEDVLKHGNEKELPMGMAKKEQLSVVIEDEKIVVSDTRSHCYSFFLDDNIYKGIFGSDAFIFWILDDYLYVNKSNMAVKYKLDTSYTRSVKQPSKLESPQNVEILEHDSASKNYSFYWNYLSSYGNLGARVEIKTSCSQSFTEVKYLTVYSNNFAFSLSDLPLDEGENLLRICHIGGPILKKDNIIELTEDSDFITYLINVKNGIFVQIQKI